MQVPRGGILPTAVLSILHVKRLEPKIDTKIVFAAFCLGLNEDYLRGENNMQENETDFVPGSARRNLLVLALGCFL